MCGGVVFSFSSSGQTADFNAEEHETLDRFSLSVSDHHYGNTCKAEHTTQFAVIILKYTQNIQHRWNKRASLHPKPKQISGGAGPSLLVRTLDLFNLRTERSPGFVHHRAAVFRMLIGVTSVHWRRTYWDDLPSPCGPHTQAHITGKTGLRGTKKASMGSN